MGAVNLFPSCSFSISWTYHHKQTMISSCVMENEVSRAKVVARNSRENSTIGLHDGEDEKLCVVLKRRSVLLSGVSLLASSAAVAGFPSEGLAVVKQGPLAGRISVGSELDEAHAVRGDTTFSPISHFLVSSSQGEVLLHSEI